MRVEVPVTYSQSQLSYIARLFSYTWYNINRKLSVGECSHMYHYTVFNHAKDKKFKQIHLGAWIAHRHTVQPKSNLQQMEYTHLSYWHFLPIQKLKCGKDKMLLSIDDDRILLFLSLSAMMNESSRDWDAFNLGSQ